MIDFDKELKKYHFFDVDDKLNGLFDETKKIISSMTTTIKRFAKEQSETNLQIEEIMNILDENKEKDMHIDDLKKSISTVSEESTAIIKGLIEIMDQLEDLYRYSLKSKTEGWSDLRTLTRA
jgi:methyl-accepting chemotaxis protein